MSVPRDTYELLKKINTRLKITEPKITYNEIIWRLIENDKTTKWEQIDWNYRADYVPPPHPESIEYRDKAKKFGLLGVEYSEALDQFARWKEVKEKAEKKKASIEKAKVTREANILKKQMI